nr:MAG TPA: hypothetical protein [Caudoviricetes sp.]
MPKRENHAGLSQCLYGHENEVYNSMMSFCNVND